MVSRDNTGWISAAMMPEVNRRTTIIER